METKQDKRIQGGVSQDMESVDPKINTSLWLYNMKKKMTIILKIKRKNKAQRAAKLWNLRRHIPQVNL